MVLRACSSSATKSRSSSVGMFDARSVVRDAVDRDGRVGFLVVVMRFSFGTGGDGEAYPPTPFPNREGGSKLPICRGVRTKGRAMRGERLTPQPPSRSGKGSKLPICRGDWVKATAIHGESPLPGSGRGRGLGLPAAKSCLTPRPPSRIGKGEQAADMPGHSGQAMVIGKGPGVRPPP